MSSSIVYVGVKAHVAAFGKQDGRQLWRTKLKTGANGDRFVSLLVDGDRLFAHTYGELFCLDARTGAILWRNPLEGLSYDLASLAVVGCSSPPLAAVAELQHEQAAAAADSPSQ